MRAPIMWAGILGIGLLAAVGSSATARAAADRPADSDEVQDRASQLPPEHLPPGTLCSKCHTETADQKHVHNPVRAGKCSLCHLQQDTSRHVFTAPENLGETCSTCHPLPARNSFHAPARDGDCMACHFPHQSDERYLLRLPTEKQLCGQCHQDELGTDRPHVHGPAAAGACSLCHLPHSSFEPSLLRESGSASCLSCHVEMNAQLELPNFVHSPVRQDCAGCHDAHASEFPFQLKAEAKALCLDCHVPMADQLAAAPSVHQALLTEKGCVHCHEVHSSPFPNMLKRPVGELCLSCHDGDIERADGTSLPGMGEKLRSSTHLHGPLEEGNCAACHDPHSSVTFSLLRKPYPQSFYAPFLAEDYALCFGCHDSKAFELETTTTHTGFRDGARNLHFLHVNNPKKGRTCRACHETHASNFPAHMTPSVPFGAWDLPIQFKPTPKGGSCAPGCHAPKEYTRFDPEVPELPPEPPETEQQP